MLIENIFEKKKLKIKKCRILKKFRNWIKLNISKNCILLQNNIINRRNFFNLIKISKNIIMKLIEKSKILNS